MKKAIYLLLITSVLMAGCGDNPEATVHVDGKIEVIIKEEKKEPIKIKKDPGGTILGNEKKFDSKDF